MRSAIAFGTLSGSMSFGKTSAAVRMFVPTSSWRAVSMAMAVSSPVIILIRTPLPHCVDGGLAVAGGPNIGSRPSRVQALSCRATASARKKPRSASAATSAATFAAIPPGDWPDPPPPAARPWRCGRWCCCRSPRPRCAWSPGRRARSRSGASRRATAAGKRRDHRGVDGVGDLAREASAAASTTASVVAAP